MKLICHRNGQALIEALLVLPVIASTLLLVALVFAWGSLNLLAAHWSYETAICLIEETPALACRRQLQKKLQLLPKKISTTKLVHYTSGTAQVFLQIQFGSLEISHQERIAQQDLQRALHWYR